MPEIDSIDNPRLIANGLRHIVYERSLSAPSYFRVAREAHLVLYRAMVEAVRGSANLAVTGRLPKTPTFRYQQGDEPWREISRVDILDCQRAWRFSEPRAIAAPNLDSPRAEEAESRLLGFYDVLAMVQTDCFMGQFTHSKRLSVSDDQMASLEWLHESVRNVYEHFIPMHYSASVGELLAASDLCLTLAAELLFGSGNVRTEPAQGSELSDLIQHAHAARSASSDLM